MTYNFKLTLIWLACGTIAVLFSLIYITGAYYNGTYVPFGPDSFYHAQRIVPAVYDLSSFTEYDPRSYAPEGTWISWPWAYDYMLAVVTRLIMQISGITDPLAILTYIPVFWIYINTGLLLGIGVTLRLRIFHLILLCLCFSFSYLTMGIHGAGRFDHHYMEYTAVVATLFGLLLWLNQPDSRSRAVFLGLVLGLSPGIQNGLFILQFPVVVTFFILWVRGSFPKTNTIYILCITFIISNVLLLIPSEPFQKFYFSYYLLSWFHLLVSICSIFAIMYFYLVDFSRQKLFLFLILSMLITSPLIKDIVGGMGFVTGGLEGLQIIQEVRSPFGFTTARTLSMNFTWTLYSFLIFLTPVYLLWGIYTVYKHKNNTIMAFGVYTVFGLSMISMQLRLHYYGSFLLYLPLLYVISSYKFKSSKLSLFTHIILVIFLVFSYYKSFNVMKSSKPTGFGNSNVFKLRAIEKLAEICEKEPGIVLVDLNEAQMLTYKAPSCSVLANNMFIDKKQARIRLNVLKYFNSTAEEVRRKEKNIKYVLVNIPNKAITLNKAIRQEAWKNFYTLNEELMLAKDKFPEGYELLDEIYIEFSDDNIKIPFARIFKVTYD